MVYKNFLFTFSIFTVSFAIIITENNQDELTNEDKPQEEENIPVKKTIPILAQDFYQSPLGYKYSYKTGNGIEVEETGSVKNKGDKHHETIIKQGRVAYHDEHGRPISFSYIADENGFQPHGDHLPTPPPLPPALQKAFAEHLQAFANEEEFQKRYGQRHQHIDQYRNQYESHGQSYQTREEGGDDDNDDGQTQYHTE